MANYNYLNQDIVATALIQPYDNDSFYNPVTNHHTGFAADGTHYTNGVQDVGPVFASWYTEYASPNTGLPQPQRGDQAAFPTYGIILLSPEALTILDESSPVPQANELKLWMLFALADNFMMTNNFDAGLQGFTPSGLAYADGIISIIYTPDSGNFDNGPGTTPPVSPPYSSITHMIVSIDFATDGAYLDVGILPVS
jgi:hypothetical protein